MKALGTLQDLDLRIKSATTMNVLSGTHIVGTIEQLDMKGEYRMRYPALYLEEENSSLLEAFTSMKEAHKDYVVQVVQSLNILENKICSIKEELDRYYTT